jgi:hypothetical protein
MFLPIAVVMLGPSVKLPHHRLLHKLDYYGVRGNTWKWVQDFLSKRTQKVVLDGVTSSCADVISGVPQGTVNMFLPIAVVMLGPSVRLLHLHHFGYVCTTDCRLRRVEHQM